MGTQNGLPCNDILSEVADRHGSLWLEAGCGILRISAEDLAKWLVRPDIKLSIREFDQIDGAFPSGYGNQPLSSRSSDGKIWFVADQLLQMIDPDDLHINLNPPRVHVEKVVADQREYAPQEGLRLTALVRNLTIQYTALSFRVPQRVKFRYMLQGQDREWQEAGIRREAFYTNLSPGHYRFRVIACNNDGIWNETGSEFGFDIPPAYYQTPWFFAFCAVALLLLIWTLYQLRLNQLKHQFSKVLKVRDDERTRIARDLHDTLLQSFQGITLHFQRARSLMPDRPVEAIKTLDTALDGAEQAIIEGRDAIHDLRSPANAARALAEEITAFGEELAAEGTDQKESVRFRTVVEGSAHALTADAYIHIFRTAREAIRNAFSHSQGHLIETELAYTESLFRLRIRDDGKGIDPDERVRAELTGHWGLKGMRERAQRLGGELEVWSEPGAGTEIELRVPGSIVYETVRSHESSWKFWRRTKNS
jgi:signal transduction histidine kinase